MLVTDLKQDEGILCTTEEECNKILDLMHDAGLKWCNGKSYKEDRYMCFLSIGQVYFPYSGTQSRKETFISGYKLYPASDFIGTEKSGNYVFKMGDKVMYDGEICYFVKELNIACIIEREFGWDRDDSIPEEYISKSGDKYWGLCPSDLSPYVEQEKSENNAKETYPDRVKRIAEEESKLQGYNSNENYNMGCDESYVHKEFSWISSRQGHSVWHNIYYNKDYSLLKQRAKDNGYAHSDDELPIESEKTINTTYDLGYNCDTSIRTIIQNGHEEKESEPTKGLMELIPSEYRYNLTQVSKKIKRFRL